MLFLNWRHLCVLAIGDQAVALATQHRAQIAKVFRADGTISDDLSVEAAPTASRDATVYAGGAEIADFAEVLWENASSTADVSTGLRDPQDGIAHAHWNATSAKALMLLSGRLGSATREGTDVGFLVALIMLFGFVMGLIVVCWPRDSKPVVKMKGEVPEHTAPVTEENDPVLNLMFRANEHNTEKFQSDTADQLRIAKQRDRTADWAMHEGRRLGSYVAVGEGAALHPTALANEEDLYAAQSKQGPLEGENLSEVFMARGAQGLSIALEGDFRPEPQDGMGVLRLLNSQSPSGSLTMSEVAAHPSCGIMVEASDYGAHLKPLAFLDTHMAFHGEMHKLTTPFVLIHKTDFDMPQFMAMGTNTELGAAAAASANKGVGGAASAADKGDADDMSDPLGRRTLPIFAAVLPDIRSSGRFLVRKRTLDGAIMYIVTYDTNGMRVMDSYLRLVARVETIKKTHGYILHASQGMDTALMISVTLAVLKLGPR